ncbi:MAG: hypothetical protein ACI93T_003886, partial [Porticoccaceae bacterium]
SELTFRLYRSHSVHNGDVEPKRFHKRPGLTNA